MKPSILKRLAATVLSSAVNGTVSFLTSLILARAFGVEVYGDLGFLMATWTAVNSAVEMGTSSAFFTFMSQGRDIRRHFRTFAFWLALRFIVLAAAVALLPAGFMAKAWLGHERLLILLALTAFFSFIPIRSFLIQTAESARQTFFIQSALAGLSLTHLTIVGTLAALKLLTLPRLFLFIVLEYAIFAAYFLLRFDWPREPEPPKAKPFGEFLKPYLAYCAPLAFFTWIGFPFEFADRWLLQYFGGSAQQGYFSLSFQFAGFVLLAAGALLNIYWKELADAQARGDFARVRELYYRASRALFFAAGAGSCFLIAHNEAIVSRLAGTGYAPSGPVLALMLLYPVYGILGQLNGAYFYATEATRAHVAISTTGLFLSMPLTYFLLAPSSAVVPGLGLGAAGLAIRWSLVTMLLTSAQGWIIARRQKAAPDTGHHLLVIAGLLSFSLAVKAVVGAFAARVGAPELVALGLSAIVYFGSALAFVRWQPEHVGLGPEHLERLFGPLRALLKTP